MRFHPVWTILWLAGCWPYIGVPSLESDLEADADTDADSDSDADTDADADAEPSTFCADGPTRTGPWDRHPLDGVDMASDPLTNDAGLDAVLDAIQGADDPLPVELRVTGAVITATLPSAPGASGRVTFWASDRSGTVVGWRIPVEFDPSTLVPGSIVDLRVSEVHNYFGVPEITGSLLAVAGGGAPVYVAEKTGSRLDYAELAQEQVEVWGELVSGPEACGDFDCFELEYGAPRTVNVRVAAGEVALGDCVHVIAPLDVYEGEPELGIDNPTWLRTF